MKNKVAGVFLLFTLLIVLSGLSIIEDKSGNLSMVYGITTAISLILLIGYCNTIKKPELWFILLFSAVLIVNIGYFTLSVSTSLEEALLANRISYLGSVFLPMSMLMIILHIYKINYAKWIPWLLFIISLLIFFVAASPGYLDIYYASVSLEIHDGVASLTKEYGPLHVLYFVYLLTYFGAMVMVIFFSSIKKRLDSHTQAIMVASAVLVNICVWLLEQLIHLDFEFLSVSYIISELFLLGLTIMVQEGGHLRFEFNVTSDDLTKEQITPEEYDLSSAPHFIIPPEKETKMKHLSAHLLTLTPTEQAIYELHIAKKSTTEILEIMNIKENTLKYHNKNIYSKLGISSKKELLELIALMNEY